MNQGGQQSRLDDPIKTKFRAVAIVLALVTMLFGLPQPAARAADADATLLGNKRPAVASKHTGRAVELGVRFTPRVDGVVTGVRFYKGSGNKGKHTASLWTSSGHRLAKATFSNESAKGWQTVKFAHPISVTAGRRYVVSYHAPHGHYAAKTGAFKTAYKRGDLTVPVNGGVRRYGSSKFPTSSKATNYFVDVNFRPATAALAAAATPTTPAAPSVSGGFPGAGTTGVPAGVTLKPYTGPTRITTPGTVIDGALITQPLVIVAGANNVTIRNSVIRASAFFLVLNDEGATNLKIIDSELDGQGNASGDSAVAGRNYTLTRVNIHGTVDGVKLGDNVTIEDSFIHDLAMFNDSHNDGMQSLGSDNVVIRHNTVIVANGATSAIILSTGSASSMRNIVIDSNLLGGGAYTVYGGYQKGVDDQSRVSGIVISNNRITTSVYTRGGAYGPFTSVDSPAVTLTGNAWYDGAQAGKSI
jgi:hypothetical protein